MKASERINKSDSTSAAEAANPVQMDAVVASVYTLVCIDVNYVQREN